MRAYISSLLPALQCSMDVRCSNGEGMILKYVTSYFSKWQNTFNRDSLFNRNIHATHIALQHLMTLNVCEPEMLFFSSAKIFATFMGKRTVYSTTPKATSLNYSRPPSAADLSLITFLRQNNTSSRKSRGTHLPVSLAAKYFSITNPLYFYQLCMMNYPHFSLLEIIDVDESLPKTSPIFLKALLPIP